MTSPEYMAEYAKRFIQTGAAIVGGCCGTNPEHIRAIRRAVRGAPAGKRMDVDAREPDGHRPRGRARSTTRAEKSRLVEQARAKASSSRSSSSSRRGASRRRRRWRKARRLFHFGIDAINIPDGPRASARMSALALAAIIQREVGIETVLHFACRDRNVIGMQSDLLGAWALGPPQHPRHHRRSAEARQLPGRHRRVRRRRDRPHATCINRLNHGLDLAGNPIGEPTGLQHRRRRQPGRHQPRRGAPAARLEDRGGRRVHDHAAGLRPPHPRAVPGADRARQASRSSAGSGRSSRTATRSS